MKSLQEELQTPKKTLDDFSSVTKRVLGHISNVVSEKLETRGYIILSSIEAGTLKYARPVNKKLFIFDVKKFSQAYDDFLTILDAIKKKKTISKGQCELIDSIVYTIQQSFGAGMDFLCNPNSARKHVGNRFEELIRLIISQIGVNNDNIVFKIPYPSSDGEKLYSCETDIIISPHNLIKSNTKSINRDEFIVSLKTTSKDRMGKIFLDKLLMQKFARHPVKVVGIFLNDVQRKESEKISYTFVSGLFMVYTKFLTELEGVYFVDPPPITKKVPFNKHIAPFSKFIVKDIQKLLLSS